ncbi:MAG: hypothetical protein ACRDVW_07780, partial [Acidimicrobiales bacterium]
MNEALAPHPPPGGAVASQDEPPGAHRPAEQRRLDPNELFDLLHTAAGGSPGIAVIYEALDLLASQFGLEDALVVVDNETLGTQAFRLQRQSIDRADLDKIGSRGFFSTPDVVPVPIQRLVTGIAEVVLGTHLAQRHLVRDRATGLLSRSVFNEALRSAAAQSSRYGWIFTVMVLRVAGAESMGEGDIRRLGYA